jgi:hypothetical protein
MADTPDPKASASAQGAGNPPQAAAGAVASTATSPNPEEVRAQAAADFAAGLKAATGYATLSELKAAQDKAAADKLAEQGQFKQLAEQAQAELARVQAAYQAERVRGSILGAAGAAVDPDVVHQLLSGQAQVGADGSVTIQGKPAAEAVAALLAAKPYLAKAAGSQGSGSGGGGAAGARTVTRSAFERLDAAGRMAHVRAGGTVVEG